MRSVDLANPVNAKRKMNALDQPRQAYFDSLYGATDDPYGVRDRWYERRKRALLLDSLPRERFGSAYEPGCGTGELTLALARRCDRVLASDWSAKALAIARTQTASSLNVTLARHELPADWPAGQAFDLIVLSELCYFLSASTVGTIAEHCAASLTECGVLVACDWKPDFDERVLSTREVHQILSRTGLPTQALHEENDFVLQVWSRDPRSVAEREGIR